MDSRVHTRDVGVQCSLPPMLYIDASVQCEVPPPATSTSPHYLAESSESELDIEDTLTDQSFHLSQESTM